MSFGAVADIYMAKKQDETLQANNVNGLAMHINISCHSIAPNSMS